MLKNKERRDSFLLGFMAIITLGFLLYVFVPWGSGNDTTAAAAKKENSNNDNNNIGNSSNVAAAKVSPDDPSVNSILIQLNNSLQKELELVYNSIHQSDDPFSSYSVEPLLNLAVQLANPVVDKLFKFSFADLKTVPTLTFPDSYSNSLKFNLYLSVFLIRIRDENSEQKFMQMPDSLFREATDFEIYSLLNNEVEYEYQLLPVLFYFKLLVKRLNYYPWLDVSGDFKKKLSPVLDLSTTKYLVRINELLTFTAAKEFYTLHWVEHDSIGPDDKKTYPHLNLDVYTYFGREYLLFPDQTTSANNQWITDLAEADSGNIELTELWVRNEDPSHSTALQKIIYTPVSSQVVMVLRENQTAAPQGLPDRLAAEAMAEFHKSFTTVTFSTAIEEDSTFKDALIAFGNYLKKINNRP